MRKSIVAANWKMNGSLESNSQWLNNYSNLHNKLSVKANLEVVVAPSFVYLAQLKEYLDTSSKFNKCFKLASQDISFQNNGAFTGQISVEMLKDFGVDYTIVGHSERRNYNNETDLEVAKKAEKVLSSGLKPIVCVGETLEQRENNQTHDIVAKQLFAVLELCKHQNLSNLVIAYEPVWAIGTGKVATPEQAQEVHCFIRNQIAECASREISDKISILYGGSVKPDNAKVLFSQKDIDGGLIGGASLDAMSFYEICDFI